MSQVRSSAEQNLSYNFETLCHSRAVKWSTVVIFEDTKPKPQVVAYQNTFFNISKHEKKIIFDHVKNRSTIMENFVSQMNHTETEKSSGWLPWSSLGTLKLASKISSDDQGSHPDDLFLSLISQVTSQVTWTQVTWLIFGMHLCCLATPDGFDTYQFQKVQYTNEDVRAIQDISSHQPKSRGISPSDLASKSLGVKIENGQVT